MTIEEGPKPGQILKRPERSEVIRKFVEGLKPGLLPIIPPHVSKDRLFAVMTTAILRKPDIFLAATTDEGKRSLAYALLDSARLGLMPDNTEGTLVAYKGLVQFQPMYRGLAKLARQSGEIQTIEAAVVREKDYYVFKRGLHPTLEHVPSSDPEPGTTVAAYSIIRLLNGGVQFDWMWKWELDRIRARSKAYTAGGGPWLTDEEEMQKKTVFLRARKFAPYQTENEALLRKLEAADAGEISDAIDVLPEEIEAVAPPEAPASPMDRLKDHLRQSAPQTPETPELPASMAPVAAPAPVSSDEAASSSETAPEPAQEIPLERRRPGRPRSVMIPPTLPVAETSAPLAAPPSSPPYSMTDFEADLQTVKTHADLNALLPNLYGATGLVARATPDAKKKINQLIVEKREALQAS